MKIITEEALKQCIRTDEYANDYIDPQEALALCKEIDTLTVSKLRPMCDAPKCKEYILIHFTGGEVLREAYYDCGVYVVDGCEIDEGHLEGWVPKTIYKQDCGK